MPRAKRIRNLEGTHKKLVRIGRRLTRLLRLKNSRVEIFLVRERDVKALRKRFYPRSKNSKAHLDVFAFPEPVHFPHPEGARAGEVYLNAERYGDDEAYLASLLLHAILHLTGYRHHRRRDTILMERMEKKLWPHVLSLV